MAAMGHTLTQQPQATQSVSWTNALHFFFIFCCILLPPLFAKFIIIKRSVRLCDNITKPVNQGLDPVVKMKRRIRYGRAA
jgi:hypothetical protein